MRQALKTIDRTLDDYIFTLPAYEDARLMSFINVRGGSATCGGPDELNRPLRCGAQDGPTVSSRRDQRPTSARTGGGGVGPHL